MAKRKKSKRQNLLKHRAGQKKPRGTRLSFAAHSKMSSLNSRDEDNSSVIVYPPSVVAEDREKEVAEDLKQIREPKLLPKGDGSFSLDTKQRNAVMDAKETAALREAVEKFGRSEKIEGFQTYLLDYLITNKDPTMFGAYQVFALNKDWSELADTLRTLLKSEGSLQHLSVEVGERTTLHGLMQILWRIQNDGNSQPLREKDVRKIYRCIGDGDKELISIFDSYLRKHAPFPDTSGETLEEGDVSALVPSIMFCFTFVISMLPFANWIPFENS